MKTRDHILTWRTSGRERRAKGGPVAAGCSCGVSWSGVPDESTVRVLHERHFAEAAEAEQAVPRG